VLIDLPLHPALVLHPFVLCLFALTPLANLHSLIFYFCKFHKKQHPITKNEKETVINLCDQKLDAVTSLLQKGLNFAVKPRSTPIEDILTSVEKAILSLPIEKAEDARQAAVRILKNSSRPTDNLKKTERAALKTLKDNVNLTILPVDKGNATVVLNTADYIQKIPSLLQDPSI